MQSVREHGVLQPLIVTRADNDTYALVAGVPARFIDWVCWCGVRLDARDPAALVCPGCQRRYVVNGGRIAPLPG